MQIFDFNIHLPTSPLNEVNNVIEEDMSLTESGLIKGLNQHWPAFSQIKGANFLLFNTNLFKGSIASFRESVKAKLQNYAFTALIDFRRNDLNEYIQKAFDEGARAIMFNSYLQKIDLAEFERVLNACKIASGLGMRICIDGSYGTSKMYTYDNLKLACYVADNISEVPIIIIHSGGYRVLEAMLLALDKTNVHLDTSFSLPYYLGSSLEQDFAFAYKKLGAEKIVFGSDHPYCNFTEALKQHLGFFEKHKFNDDEIEKIMYRNAVRLFAG
jgi:predicted TIM-barrel fold metal-dependent hydrolase